MRVEEEQKKRKRKEEEKRVMASHVVRPPIGRERNLMGNTTKYFHMKSQATQGNELLCLTIDNVERRGIS